VPSEQDCVSVLSLSVQGPELLLAGLSSLEELGSADELDGSAELLLAKLSLLEEDGLLSVSTELLETPAELLLGSSLPELLLNSSLPEEDGSPTSTLDDEPSAEDFSM
jgi:hypothetical protein